MGGASAEGSQPAKFMDTIFRAFSAVSVWVLVRISLLLEEETSRLLLLVAADIFSKIGGPKTIQIINEIRTKVVLKEGMEGEEVLSVVAMLGSILRDATLEAGDLCRIFECLASWTSEAAISVSSPSFHPLPSVVRLYRLSCLVVELYSTC